MSIRVVEFEPQLVFPTMQIPEILFLLGLFKFASGNTKTLEIGFVHQIQNSTFSIKVEEQDGESVGLIVDQGASGVVQVKRIDAKVPYFLLGQAYAYSYGGVPGKALAVKALVSKV